MTESTIHVNALLSDDVVERQAVRLFSRSQWTIARDPAGVEQAWERLSEPMRSMFLANAREDLAAAAAQAGGAPS